MRRETLARRAGRIASAGLLACCLAAGGATAVALAPLSDASKDPAIAQTAQATARASTAKAAYKRFLAGAGYQWQQFDRAPGYQNASSYKFCLGDIDGNGVPELFVQNDDTYYAAGYSRVYAYQKGKVKLIGRFSIPPSKIYKKAHLLYYWDMHTGSHWGGYFKLSKGKLVIMASWRGTDMKMYAKHPLHKANGIYYTSYRIGLKQKSVSYKKYCSYVRSLLKAKKMPREDMIGNSMSYHANTPANRARYL